MQVKAATARKRAMGIAVTARGALRPGTTFASLRTGSATLIRAAWSRIAPQSSTLARLGYTGVGLYAAGLSAAKIPSRVGAFVVPIAVLGWCVAAWIVAPPIAPRPPAEEPQLEPPDAFRLWLLQLIGERPGIHLRELYPAMRRLPGHERLNDAQLRAALRTLGVPVDRSVRIGLLAGRSGVYRRRLAPLPSPAGEQCGEHGVDAGQSAVSPPGEPLEIDVEHRGEATS